MTIGNDYDLTTSDLTDTNTIGIVGCALLSSFHSNSPSPVEWVVGPIRWTLYDRYDDICTSLLADSRRWISMREVRTTFRCACILFRTIISFG